MLQTMNATAERNTDVVSSESNIASVPEATNGLELNFFPTDMKYLPSRSLAIMAITSITSVTTE